MTIETKITGTLNRDASPEEVRAWSDGILEEGNIRPGKHINTIGKNPYVRAPRLSAGANSEQAPGDLTLPATNYSNGFGGNVARDQLNPDGIPVVRQAAGALAATDIISAPGPQKTSTELTHFGEAPTLRGAGAEIVPYVDNPNDQPPAKRIELTDVRAVEPEPSSFDADINQALDVANSANRH